MNLNAHATYRSVLFDLDGTLTDSGPGIMNSVRYALGKSGVSSCEDATLRYFVGPPLRESFHRYYGFDAGACESAVGFYHEYFADKGMYENSVYEGIPGLLAALRERGCLLIVATSKPTVHASAIISHFGLDRFFTAIEGSLVDGGRSEKAELIRCALENHRLDAKETAMVGDRMYDVIGARSNGIDSIGVGYGYGSEEELRGSGATAYCATVKALSDYLLNAAV